jgi:transaldolase
LVSATIDYAKSLDASVSTAERLSSAVDFLAVQFGIQIYKLTGRVGTEVDVSLSFDAEGTVASALRLLDLYEAQGVPKSAVRVKISGTWEGIQAARVLQKEHGVSCLVTVVFSIVQAIAAAEAGVDAIAPHVGRLADWGKLDGVEGDFGVQRVTTMQNYLRKYGYSTKVMAASFRNTDQVRNLAGVDLLTAAPGILEALRNGSEDIVAKLTAESGIVAYHGVIVNCSYRDI